MSEGILISDMDTIKPILPRTMKVECLVLLRFYQQTEENNETNE